MASFVDSLTNGACKRGKRLETAAETSIEQPQQLASLMKAPVRDAEIKAAKERHLSYVQELDEELAENFKEIHSELQEINGEQGACHLTQDNLEESGSCPTI
jgi:hypothetical protein